MSSWSFATSSIRLANNGGLLTLGLIGTIWSALLGTQQSAPSQTVGTQGQVQSTPQEERMVDFVDAVAGDVQGMWEQTLGGRYERTRIVLFRDSIESFRRGMDSGDLRACGAAARGTQ